MCMRDDICYKILYAILCALCTFIDFKRKMNTCISICYIMLYMYLYVHCTQWTQVTILIYDILSVEWLCKTFTTPKQKPTITTIFYLIERNTNKWQRVHKFYYYIMKSHTQHVEQKHKLEFLFEQISVEAWQQKNERCNEK